MRADVGASGVGITAGVTTASKSVSVSKNETLTLIFSPGVAVGSAFTLIVKVDGVFGSKIRGLKNPAVTRLPDSGIAAVMLGANVNQVKVAFVCASVSLQLL